MTAMDYIPICRRFAPWVIGRYGLFLTVKSTWRSAAKRFLAATRQLAKRQLTWLRSWPDLTWLLTDEAGRLVQSSRSAVEAKIPSDTAASDGPERLWNARIQELMRNF